jgi:hypothetical protein
VSGPEVVYIDKRVARQMDQEGGGDLLAYVRQDIHEKAVRSAGARERETIIQILTNPDGRLVGLSTWGRVWAFVAETKEDLPGWIIVTDQLPAQELDS